MINRFFSFYLVLSPKVFVFILILGMGPSHWGGGVIAVCPLIPRVWFLVAWTLFRGQLSANKDKLKDTILGFCEKNLDLLGENLLFLFASSEPVSSANYHLLRMGK